MQPSRPRAITLADRKARSKSLPGSRFQYNNLKYRNIRRIKDIPQEDSESLEVVAPKKEETEISLDPPRISSVRSEEDFPKTPDSEKIKKKEKLRPKSSKLESPKKEKEENYDRSITDTAVAKNR